MYKVKKFLILLILISGIKTASANTCSSTDTTLEDALLKVSTYIGIFSDSTAVTIAGRISNKTNNYASFIDNICGYINDKDKGFFKTADFILNFAPSPYKEILQPYIKFGESLATAVNKIAESINFQSFDLISSVDKVHLKIYKDGFWFFDKDISPYNYRHLIEDAKVYLIMKSDSTSKRTFNLKNIYPEGMDLVLDFNENDMAGGGGDSYAVFIEIKFINGSKLFIPASREFVEIEGAHLGYKITVKLKTETDDTNNSNYFIDTLRVVK
ncbi:hypothetical protein [Persephonella sp.]